MAEHIYEKEALINRLESYLGKTFEMIDNKGMFEHVQDINLQKGIAGAVVEQCIFEYPHYSRQEADLIIVEGDKYIKTELKTTGLLIQKAPKKHYIAKEPMSITAVGVYDLAEQEFETSHFWEKLEHMLIIYYHYSAKHAVSAYDYKDFQMVGYEFHEFSNEDIEILKNDWENVRSLCKEIISHHPGEKNKEWKAAVKKEYIDVHTQLRRVLSYIDLAPKFPPRFRLKKPMVSSIIAKHFGYDLEQLPGKYMSVSDIDAKCKELTDKYAGKSIRQLSRTLGLEVKEEKDLEQKGIAEKIVVSMFGGKAKKLNQIALFEKFGLIGKTITFTSNGGRTEDMKLYHVDFEEMLRDTIIDDNGDKRQIMFEDSDMYGYFADHELLCIIFKESTPNDTKKDSSKLLASNIFVGFKRIVFSEEFINTTVKKLWEDTRDKIKNHKLIDVVQKSKNGSIVFLKNGEISTAPNFLKGSDNDVFLRGSGQDSALVHKTECVNGICMLPQYVWIKGLAVVNELNQTPEI